MLCAALVSLAVANSPLHGPFSAFWNMPVSVAVGPAAFTLPLAHVVNDVLMAVFFLLVGLEVKYEFTAGELTDPRRAVLPIVAALGGVAAPIGIYLAFNAANPATAGGWGVPTATDIAFALGILSLLGSRVPTGLKVFLSTLAVADDIIAILVIALFYGHAPELHWLAAAAAVIVVLAVLNRRHIHALAPYLLLGVALWACVFLSGIHSTIAGVLLALTIPTTSSVDAGAFHTWAARQLDRARDSFDAAAPIVGQHRFLDLMGSLSRLSKQVVPPATRLEKRLHPWVYFLILPLFALGNADVCLTDGSVGDIFANPALFGIFLGLVLGKPAGILAASALVVKSGLAPLPTGVTWGQMVGAGMLAGVGFTMAIFVANLAFADAATVAVAKAAVLAASVVAGLAGFLFLRTRLPRQHD